MFRVVPVTPLSKIRKYRLCPTYCKDLESALKEFTSYKVNFGVTCNIIPFNYE